MRFSYAEPSASLAWRSFKNYKSACWDFENISNNENLFKTSQSLLQLSDFRAFISKLAAQKGDDIGALLIQPTEVTLQLLVVRFELFAPFC